MKTNRTAVLTALFCCFFVAGCNSSSVAISTQQVNEREYSKAVTVGDVHVLDIECHYLGKEPPDGVSASDPGKAPDYYEVAITNVSDATVTLESARFSMRIGPYRGKASRNQDDLKKVWTSTTIGPGKAVTRNSHFVWAVKSSNALVKEYAFVMQSADGDVRFSVTVPLEYRR